MRPDAASPFPSHFSAIPEAEWPCANDFAVAIFDSFPVSPGHVLVIPRYSGDMPGPDRPLWPRLADRLPGATEIDLLASFVQTSRRPRPCGSSWGG